MRSTFDRLRRGATRRTGLLGLYLRFAARGKPSQRGAPNGSGVRGSSHILSSLPSRAAVPPHQRPRPRGESLRRRRWVENYAGVLVAFRPAPGRARGFVRRPPWRGAERFGLTPSICTFATPRSRSVSLWSLAYEEFLPVGRPR